MEKPDLSATEFSLLCDAVEDLHLLRYVFSEIEGVIVYIDIHTQPSFSSMDFNGS